MMMGGECEEDDGYICFLYSTPPEQLTIEHLRDLLLFLAEKDQVLAELLQGGRFPTPNEFLIYDDEGNETPSSVEENYRLILPALREYERKSKPVEIGTRRLKKSQGVVK